MQWLMRRIRILLLLLVALAVAVIAYSYSGLQEVAADREHWLVTRWLLETTRERSVASRAHEVDGEVPQMTRERLRDAVVGFESMCAGCHAPPEQAESGLARGLNPPATDLARAAERRSPAELFWVTRHGIRMTGMPAWGVTHEDEELWQLVGLIRRFPEMSGAEYETLLAEAREAGIEHEHDHEHDPDHGHEHEHEHAPDTDEHDEAHDDDHAH